LFLFDSFDEIPAVLASTDHSDDAVQVYSDALRGFLTANQSKCWAVIASRESKATPGRVPDVHDPRALAASAARACPSRPSSTGR
jgi:hypothetical protein